MAKAFVGYSFGTLRKKHQPFSMTQPFVFVTELSYSIFSFLSVIEISSFLKSSVFIESLFPAFPVALFGGSNIFETFALSMAL